MCHHHPRAYLLEARHGLPGLVPALMLGIKSGCHIRGHRTSPRLVTLASGLYLRSAIQLVLRLRSHLSRHITTPIHPTSMSTSKRTTCATRIQPTTC